MTLKRLLCVFAFAAAAGVLLHFVIGGIHIDSASMEPTLSAGTNVFLNKTAYLFRPPRRGEIIVFANPAFPHEESVTRVVAVAGDRVELRNMRLLLNGEEVVEDYAHHTRSGEKGLVGDYYPQSTVPADTVFVIGDNRGLAGETAMWRDPPEINAMVRWVPVRCIRGRLFGAH
ncbi:MAG: signal peptidase I [Elusimicrobiota bacterium]